MLFIDGFEKVAGSIQEKSDIKHSLEDHLKHREISKPKGKNLKALIKIDKLRKYFVKGNIKCLV